MLHSNKKSQISALKSPVKISLVRSKSTDHLTSTHKSIGRKNNNQKTNCHDLSMNKIVTITKTKSVKSLKLKNKSIPKNNDKSNQTKSTKKIKNKNKKNQQSDCKTLKKIKTKIIPNLSQQSFNSLQSIKKQPLEYFLYQNIYIPVQNSAQRRFVFKIKQIDRNNSSTSDTFFKKDYQSQQLEQQTHDNTFKITNQINSNSFKIAKNVENSAQTAIKKVELQDSCVQTQHKVILQFGTNTTPRRQIQVSIQTQTTKFQQNISKCFSKTLNDLQFLYLPDQTNFQGFSKPQKLHYRQLFQSIAKKIWTNGQNLQQLNQQKVQILIYQRECIQMGMLQFYPEQGFPTHIYAIMSYLTNLFSYAQINYKYQALQKIHSIYGYNYQQRFSRLLKGLPTKRKSQPILPQQLFLALQKQLFKQHQFGSQLIEKSVHIHNKALFDAANEQLQKFKPFYFSKGQPFTWSIDVGMTFFSIDQSTVGLLFKQIKQKLLIKFGYLCGILLDYDQYKQTPNKQKHEMHIKKLQVQQQKMIHDQANQVNYTPEIQQSKTQLKCDLSTWILAQLLEQLCCDINELKDGSFQKHQQQCQSQQSTTIFQFL